MENKAEGIVKTEEDENIYSIYIHINLHNNKVYIGITYKGSKERWNDGDGYKHNFEFYSDIRQYGWETGFHHHVIRENLSYEKAKEEERHFIDIYDATNPEKGYNHKKGGSGYSKKRENTKVGDKLKQLRKSKKITQQELADLLGLTRATISNYEVNRRIPDLPALKLYTDYFGVGLDFFGAISTDVSFDISSKVTEYFKSDNIEESDKIELLNDIIASYTSYVLKKR
ncbi:MAG: helix-turn-helix domain-containing protein [Ruminiclostridium sp.]|nr:helix-turn-helix domain-containing protein [Ruminiclostridium sp.]